MEVKAVDSVFKYHVFGQKLTLTVNGVKYNGETDIVGKLKFIGAEIVEGRDAVIESAANEKF